MNQAKALTAEQDEVVIDDCWNRIGVWGKQQPRCPELEKVIHCANCKVYSSTGRLLLDRKPDNGYIESWYEQLRLVQRKKDHNATSVVVFRLSDEWLALPARMFQEVVDMRIVHRVPHSKSSVLKGLVNIRGELQLCVSLGRLLGVERHGISVDDAASGIYARMVVITDGEMRYVFPVSEVRGIQRYTPTDLQNVPATAERCSNNYMGGMLNIDDKQVGCLDPDLFFSALKRMLS